MKRARLIRGVVLTLIATILLVVPTWAVSATNIEAKECDLAPLHLPLFGGTPLAEVVAQDALATPAADTYSEAAILDALKQYVACTNTGNPTLVWAIFSPRWFSAIFADPQQHYLPAFEQMISLPGVVDVTEPLELLKIQEIAALPDGRIDVTASFRSGDQEWQDTLTLVHIDGQWLIDDVRLDTSAS